MSNKKNRTWIASEKTTVSEIQKIQEKFKNKVNVSLFHDGRVAVYPAWSGKRSAFDRFMKQNNSFTQAVLAPNEI
jgi:hypothetical protein